MWSVPLIKAVISVGMVTRKKCCSLSCCDWVNKRVVYKRCLCTVMLFAMYICHHAISMLSPKAISKPSTSLCIGCVLSPSICCLAYPSSCVFFASKCSVQLESIFLALTCSPVILSHQILAYRKVRRNLREPISQRSQPQEHPNDHCDQTQRDCPSGFRHVCPDCRPHSSFGTQC